MLAVASAALLAPAPAQADSLGADVSHTGNVDIGYSAPVGTQVEFNERVGARVKLLGISTVTKRPGTGLLNAVKWRCDRLVRRFEAIGTAPDGSRSQDAYDVRTPSCRDRLSLSVPRRAARGALVRIRAKDRWTNGGIRPRLCITPPHAKRSCGALNFPRTVDLAGRSFRPGKRGVWLVDLSLNGHHFRAKVAVGGAHAGSTQSLPTVLATGDSTMQGIDSFLADRLAQTMTVRSDRHHGTAVSKDFEWLTRAKSQTKKYRQRATVISLGGEGYPMQAADGATHECCDALWADEYVRRVRVVMKTYLRHGKGRVLWLATPTAKNPEIAAVTNVTNASLLRAAEGLKRVQIVRLDTLFTPNGYRETMPYRGKTVQVRASDGAHLNVTGTAIAAEAIEKILRTDPP